MTLSDRLDELDRGAAAWLEQCKRATKAVEALRKATAAGNLRDMERLRQNAIQASEGVAARARDSAPLDVDPADYLAPEGGFLDELKAAAQAAEVSLYERDGIVYCYPVLVRPEPESACIRIDKARETTLRPSALAAILKRLQSREAKAKPERFIETLHWAYERVRAFRGDPEGADVPLTEIYEALTPLPGSEREYTLLDFTRDLYFLDTSGVLHTRRGALMTLPASTVTREKKAKILPFVDRQGREKLYALVRFTPET